MLCRVLYVCVCGAVNELFNARHVISFTFKDTLYLEITTGLKGRIHYVYVEQTTGEINTIRLKVPLPYITFPEYRRHIGVGYTHYYGTVAYFWDNETKLTSGVIIV